MVNYFKNKYFLISVFLVVISLFIAIFYLRLFPSKLKEAPAIENLTEQQSEQSVATTSPTISGLKTYRNEEWGFEFQYPQDWIVKERTFGSYYSKFNMVIRPTSGWYSQFPVSINIVLPEFPDRSFKKVEKITSEAIVDGVPGVKYQYRFKGSQETAIILPLGEYKMILGADRDHEEIFNQILTSFKFLK